MKRVTELLSVGCYGNSVDECRFVESHGMKPPTNNCAGSSPAINRLRLLEQHSGLERGRIARLQEECEVFLEICADHEQCCSKLQILEQEGQAIGERARQYTEMRDLLEQEITLCLEGVPPCHCCRKQLGPKQNPDNTDSNNKETKA